MTDPRARQAVQLVFKRLSTLLKKYPHYRVRRGATAAALDALERTLGTSLAAQHRAFLELTDGWGPLRSYELLSVKDLARWWSTRALDVKKGRKWKATHVPFAVDSCGNLLCVESDKGRVLLIDRQEGFAVGKPGLFVAAWLREIERELQSGALEIDADGFVSEPVTAPIEAPGGELPRLEVKEADPIEAAIAAADLKKLKKLLAPTGPNAVTWAGVTLLRIAVEKHQPAVVKWMLANGADVDCGKAQGLRTALFESTWGPKADPAMTKLLLEHDADPNALTAYDGTPLHGAAMWGNPQIVSALLAAGANKKLKDAQGKTPAQLAKAPALRKLLA